MASPARFPRLAAIPAVVLTMRQVATRLGVSLSKAHQLANRGELGDLFRPGGRKVVDAAAVDRYLESTRDRRGIR